MANERDPHQAGRPPAAAAKLPRPERLPAYSFASHYDALMLPLWLGMGGLALVLLHIGLMSLYIDGPDEERITWAFVSTFDLDSEESFGTYFSVLSLLFIGRLLWHEGKRSLRAREVWCVWWFVLAILFHLLSIEEVVDGHEMLESYKDELAEADVMPWQGEAFWAAMFIGAAFVPFLWQLGWRFALFALTGGAIYLLAGLGIDVWEARSGRYTSKDNYHLWTALEEGLELLAPLLFLHGLLAWSSGKSTGTVVETTEITA